MMRVSPQGAEFTGRHEGFVGKWYRDPVGIGTIGHGFTWRSEAFREWWQKHRPGVAFGPSASMTRKEAADCLRFLLDHEYGRVVNRFFNGKAVEQNVFDGTTDVVFNCGERSLSWRWAQAVASGSYSTAARLLATTAVTGQGSKKILPGLQRRRHEEGVLIAQGIYHFTKRVRADDGVLERGESGPAVEKLINDLAALGYYPKDATRDDIFGTATQSAVLEFQEHYHLKPDGIAGPKTLEMIEYILNGTEPPEKSWWQSILEMFKR